MPAPNPRPRWIRRWVARLTFLFGSPRRSRLSFPATCALSRSPRACVGRSGRPSCIRLVARSKAS
eukprot:2772408-Alexandrium_andersonii.AAC.1